jgi:hypothetical protein
MDRDRMFQFFGRSMELSSFGWKREVGLREFFD